MSDSVPSNSLSIDPCPFCHEAVDQHGDESWYFRGDGPPPSYAVRCDSCGAQGPYGNGKFRKDHAGAQVEAVRLWNERARAVHEPRADLPKPINHDLWRHLHDEHGLTLLQSELDEILRLAQPPVPVPKFKVGDRVEWTNMLQNTFVGSIIEVKTDTRYVVQFDDRTVGQRGENDLRPVPTKGEKP